MDPNEYEDSEDGDLNYIDSDDLDGMQIISENDMDDSSYEDYDREDYHDLYDSMSNVRHRDYFVERVY
jgi:hypothetical protein